MLFRFLTYTLYTREYKNLMQFLSLTFLGSRFYPSTMDITILWFTARKLGDFPLFHVSPVSRCVAAENSVFNDLDILRKQIVTFRFNNNSNNNSNNNNSLLLQCVLFKDLSIVLVFCVFLIGCLLIVLCYLCYLWPSGCWLGALINMNWIELNYYCCCYYNYWQAH
jgi:hypothetical protein